MLSKPSPLYPQRRRPRRKAPPPTIAQGPVLVSVSTDFEGPSITLNFDRDMDVEAYDGTQLTIVNAGADLNYNGTGGVASLEGNQIQIYLADTGPYAGTQTVMNATATTGIRAASDGAAWAGVTDYPV